MNLEDYRKQTNQLLSQYQHTSQQVREEKEHLQTARLHLSHSQEAQLLFQEVAEQIQQSVHLEITKVVTHCLSTIFEDAYQFAILFEKKRGKTEARPVFYRDGNELDPLSAAGGGVCDVAAFALRLACLMMQRPRLRRLLVLDEPFSALKPPDFYGPKIQALLTTLSEKLGVQFLIVQNVEEYRCGKVIEL